MHEYLKRLYLAMERGLIFKPAFYEMSVEHDNWCSFNQGGVCNCDPRITINGPQGDIRIDKNGNPKPLREQ